MSGPATPEERLAAWLDGALSPGEAAAFEAELARDPQLAERAATWRRNDAFMAGALAPILDEPIGNDVLARMGLGDAPAAPYAEPVAANDNPPWWRSYRALLGGAIAAGLALTLVMVQRPGTTVDDGGLSLALDTTPALQSARLADGRTIVPQLTAQAADGRWCREYRQGNLAGLACRGSNGWKIEAQGKAAPAIGAGDYATASGQTAPEVDSANARLNMADPLDPAAERALMASKWGSR